MAELTYKQRLFVDYYLGESNGNATEAARKAGYALPHPQGAENLQKPTIRAAIDAKLSVVAMSSKEVLARLAEIAAASFDDFIQVDSSGDHQIDLKRAKKRGKLRIIHKLKEGRYGVELELKDSQAALVQLGKYHGLWDREPEPEIDLKSIAERMKARRKKRDSDNGTT